LWLSKNTGCRVGEHGSARRAWGRRNENEREHEHEKEKEEAGGRRKQGYPVLKHRLKRGK
jgi:hypothetical protein